MKAVFTVAAAIGLAGCYAQPSDTTQSRKSYEIAMCPEPLRVSDCKVEIQDPYCTFENTAQQALSGYPSTWGYNSGDIQLARYPIVDLAGTQPGQKKRVQLVLGGEYKKVSKIVVCSMDPQDPMMKGQIVNVGTAQ
jgi:hypothetical protein